MFPHANSRYDKASNIKRCDTNDETKFQSKRNNLTRSCVFQDEPIVFLSSIRGEQQKLSLAKKIVLFAEKTNHASIN